MTRIQARFGNRVPKVWLESWKGKFLENENKMLKPTEKRSFVEIQ